MTRQSFSPNNRMKNPNIYNSGDIVVTVRIGSTPMKDIILDVSSAYASCLELMVINDLFMYIH